MTSIPTLVVAVTIFALVAAGICLILGIVAGFLDRATVEKQTPKTIVDGKVTPVQAQAGADFTGLGKLAEALANLNLSGRLLVVGLSFAAVAAVAAGTGSIASAVA